jgi:uncharacterized RDD family membrane protein YckC
MVVDEDLGLITPEQGEFDYQRAGLGVRFVACLLDTLIQGGVILAMLVIAGVAVLWIADTRDVEVLGQVAYQLSSWFVAAVLLTGFASIWGYYVFFELRWNGQSPGKRLLRLRVLRDNGDAVDFFPSLARNLVRYVDFLPVCYGVGGLSVLLSRKRKRLGDYVAGTMVIKEQGIPYPEAVQRADAEPIGRRALELTSDEYTMIRDFLVRRNDLEPQSRHTLARFIAGSVADKLGQDLPEDPATCEALLDDAARAYRRRVYKRPS